MLKLVHTNLVVTKIKTSSLRITKRKEKVTSYKYVYPLERKKKNWFVLLDDKQNMMAQSMSLKVVRVPLKAIQI